MWCVWWIGMLVWNLPFAEENFEAKLVAYYQTVETIQADFVQKKESGLLQEALVTKGKFYYSAPDRIRWEQTSPANTYLILSGNSVTQFDGKTVKKSNGGGIQLNVFREFILKTADGSILQDSKFTRTYEDLGKKVRVNLVPVDKQMAKRLAKISLLFDAQTLVLDELVLMENAQELTQITFTSQKINGSLSEALFK